MHLLPAAPAGEQRAAIPGAVARSAVYFARPSFQHAQYDAQMGERFGDRATTGMEMDSLEAIKKAVLSGESISFISRAAIMQEVERGELLSRPIPQNPYKRYMYVAFNEDRIRSTLFDRFRDYLREGVRML
ncbi:LysR substrate-binding domain-containing protein [Paenibacillus ginsengarvi]|uniref:LysR substrate-binding domain-containing protein n=1 Tax=Paenibacillus ginsengarvi TaxID=400777 RepID=UPI003B834A0B